MRHFFCRYVQSHGVLGVSYQRYSKSDKWRWGVDVHYESFSIDDRKGNYHLSAMPKFDYFWSSADKKWRFYSGLSLGGLQRSVYKEERSSEGELQYYRETITDMFFNINPIGIRYGQDWAVFLEPANIGSKAVINFGVSHRF